MIHYKKYPVILLAMILFGCNSSNKNTSHTESDAFIEEDVKRSDLGKDVEMLTDYGSVIIRLSDSTPKHRNNFIKLVNQKFYDSLSFHRVIRNFVIQAGDPESKNPDTDKVLGETDLPYSVPAEFNRSLYHKRGALGAARESDEINPLRASSSTQFYIVQGRVYTDSTLTVAKGRINNWLAYNLVLNAEKNTANALKLRTFLENETTTDSIDMLRSEFNNQADSIRSAMDDFDFTRDHQTIYKTLGGTAHLDGNYTVFGEVIKGMEVIDTISAVETNDMDRPLKDVRIIRARLIERKNYN